MVSHSDLLLRLPEGAVECKACEEIQKYLVQRARLRLSVDDAVFIWGGHKLWDTRKVNLLLHKRLKLDFLLTQEKMAQIHGNLNEYMMQAETVMSVSIEKKWTSFIWLGVGALYGKAYPPRLGLQIAW